MLYLPVDEELDHLYMVILGGLVQGCRLLIVERVNTGIVLDQQTHDSQVAVDSRQVEWVHVDVVRGVHIRSWKTESNH